MIPVSPIAFPAPQSVNTCSADDVAERSAGHRLWCRLACRLASRFLRLRLCSPLSFFFLGACFSASSFVFAPA